MDNHRNAEKSGVLGTFARLRGDGRRLAQIHSIASNCINCAQRDLDADKPDGARVMLSELELLVSELLRIATDVMDVAKTLDV